MAKVTITESGAALARALFAEFPPYAEPTRPVLAIRWSAGAAESRRGASGESLWELVEPAGWLAEIAAWGESEDTSLEDHAILVNGLPVLLGYKANTAAGSFILTAAEGRLRVEYEA